MPVMADWLLFGLDIRLVVGLTSRVMGRYQQALWWRTVGSDELPLISVESC